MVTCKYGHATNHITKDKTCNVPRLFGKHWSRVEAELNKCELVCANCHIRTESRIGKPVDTFEYLRSKPRKKLKELTINGETLTIEAWSQRSGIPAERIRERITEKWEPERAVYKPLQRRVVSTPYTFKDQ
jgi:hypothetical protein